MDTKEKAGFWFKKMDEFLEIERKNGLTGFRLFVHNGGDESSATEDIAEDFCSMYESIEWDPLEVVPL